MTLYRIQSTPDDGPILYLAAAGALTEDADKALGWLEIVNAEEVLAASSICRGHSKDFCVNAFEEKKEGGPSAETEAGWAEEDKTVAEAQAAEVKAQDFPEGAGAPEPGAEPTDPPGPEPDSQPDTPGQGEPEPEPEPGATEPSVDAAIGATADEAIKEPEPVVTPTGSGPASG